MSQQSIINSQTHSPYIIPLSEVDANIIQIKDFDLDVAYKRIFDPVESATNIWSIHFKDNGTPDWITVNGSLTSRYSIAMTEKILVDIQKNIGGQLLDQKFKRSGTYIKTLFLMSGFDIESEPITDADKILFKLITGIDIDNINSRRNLSFCAINGFAGNFALTLYYGILTLWSGSDAQRKLIKHGINNIFVLNKFSSRLIHDSSLKVNYSEIRDVKSNLTAEVNSYKIIDANIQFIKKFYGKFPKKFTRIFMTLFDNLPNEYKNLYYVTQIWSHLCYSVNDVYLEFKLRNFLSSYIRDLRTSETAARNNQ